MSVHILTASWKGSLTWAGEREAWLKQHFDLDYNDITFSHAKHKVHGDIFIDDKPSSLELWQARHPNGVALLWKDVWNRPHHSKWLGADNWPHMIEEITFQGYQRTNRLSELEILLDCDGPLSDLHYTMMRWLYREYPDYAAMKWQQQPEHWAVQQSLPPERAAALNAACMQPGFCASLGIVEGAQTAVKYLRSL